MKNILRKRSARRLERNINTINRGFKKCFESVSWNGRNGKGTVEEILDWIKQCVNLVHSTVSEVSKGDNKLRNDLLDGTAIDITIYHEYERPWAPGTFSLRSSSRELPRVLQNVANVCAERQDYTAEIMDDWREENEDADVDNFLDDEELSESYYDTENSASETVVEFSICFNRSMSDNVILIQGDSICTCSCLVQMNDDPEILDIEKLEKSDVRKSLEEIKKRVKFNFYY